MKPISIRFKCFGPYQQEQFIDFRELEKSGLFLICGETGSGKTTILDAMCYALYGKSSGGYRGKLADMRCKGADPNDATLVEYVFSSGEHTYRFYRAVRPRKQRRESAEAGKPQSFNEEYECQILKDGQFVPMSDTKAIQRYMDSRAEEILGLRYEQFKQVVILPQGQFEKLLTSNSDEKEEILVTLFHAEKWQKIANLICQQVAEEKKTQDERRIKLDAQLDHFGCGTLDELAAMTEHTRQEAENLKTRCEALDGVIAQRKKEYDKARDDDQAFCVLDRAEQTLTQLTARKEIQSRNRERLRRAQAAEQIAPACQAYQQKQTTAKKAIKARDEREEELRAARQEMDHMRAEAVSHEHQRERFEAQKKQVILLEGLKEVYQTLDDKKRAWERAEQEYCGAEKKFQSARTALEQAQTTLEQAVLTQKEAEQAFHRGQEIYMRNIGSELAAKLVEGQKCPVCGSCHHPEPAQPTEDHVSKETLGRLTRANKKAMDDMSLAIDLRERASEKLSQEKEEVSKHRQNAEISKQLYEQALTQRIEKIGSETQRQAAIRKLNGEISAFAERDQFLRERYSAADGAFQSAERLAEDARNTAGAAEHDLAEAKLDWAAKLAAAGFENEKEFLASNLDAAERQNLQTEIIRFKKELDDAESAVKELAETLGARVRPDVVGASISLRTAEEEKTTVYGEYVTKDNEYNIQRSMLDLLSKEIPVLDKAQLRNRENMEFAQKLRGDSGISLQRYVLGVMLTSITGEANRLLKTVYGGRYQLYRTNEASGKAHKRGLELEVADRDGRRTVNSLSGGEKFLLSLSLGIGLASVVQAQGGGIRLEAMFIDEGFGSLDGKCIDDAMEILESVRRSAGIVGIISHVDRLAETIPAKIKIKKTKHGSQCKISC